MKKGFARLAIYGVVVTLLLCCLVACQGGGRSSQVICGERCSSYQHTDSLPDQPPPGVVRLAIGGDSRDDRSRVLPWAFKEAGKRGAKAFFFLGDLQIDRALDKLTAPRPENLPFYPLMGNHEVEILGAIRLPGSQHAVKEFKDDFLKSSGIRLAPFEDEVVYSVDLEGGVHFIALDNVSRKGEGFGPQQLAWLETDLRTASAAKKVILVGMHKALAENPVTTHAMDEDRPNGIIDSRRALELFKNYNVAMVFVSHSHMYASYNQGIEVRLTGGLGAPLVKGLAEADGGFHHFLLVDVPRAANQTPLLVEVVKFPCRFPCTPTKDDQDESKEVE